MKLIKEAKDYMFGGWFFILHKIFDIVDEPEHDYQV